MAQLPGKAPDFSLWVHGELQEPGLHLDRARMTTRLYQEVRDDLVRYSPVEVTRSAIRRSDHAYVGVIDSHGVPYYFALNSRGVFVQKAPPADAWKAFDQLATDEHMAAVVKRRGAAAAEMRRVDRELSSPLVVTKGIRYGKKVEWRGDVPHSTWWRNVKHKKPPAKGKDSNDAAEEPSGVDKSGRRRGDRLSGGRADRKKPSDFDPRRLRVGAAHEREHTRDATVAREIAMDHLVEDPSYYRKLARVEKTDDEGRCNFGNRYAAEYRRVGHELWLQVNDGESELDPPRPEDALYLDKALPRKSKEKEAKKAPARKASKKQGGAGGKTRYTYPGEGSKRGAGQAPLVVTHQDHKHADPAELAEQLGVSVRTLRRAAKRLGSDRFGTFMRSRLKTFAMKHRLDPDYWGTLYAALMSGSNGELEKSDAGDALKKFGDDVKRTASAVPDGHKERFGDRKVFIHHVHSKMKESGAYSGSLDDFKRDVVSAHRKGHLEAARADLVSAMDPRSVEQSETKTDGATFHFINNAKHDPKAVEKPKPAAPDKPKTKMSSKFHREVAHTLSDEARDATAHAEKVKTPEAHIAAMSAHHQAGAAHQKASGKVNHKAALAHFDQSIAHLKAARATPGAR